MRRFTIAVGGGGGETEPWLDTGFVKFVAGKDDDGRCSRPDVLVISAAEAGWEEAVTGNWPKVIIFSPAAPTALTAEVAEAFRLHRWQPQGLSLVLATRLEVPLAEPDWELYHEDGLLTPPVAVKSVADSVYRHLLADVFRDTAEWCGHTFSVVVTI